MRCVSQSKSVSHSVVCDSLRPHGLWPASLLCPWDFPGRNTGVGSHPVLQGIFPTQGSSPGLPDHRQILYHLSHQHFSSLHHLEVVCLLGFLGDVSWAQDGLSRWTSTDIMSVVTASEAALTGPRATWPIFFCGRSLTARSTLYSYTTRPFVRIIAGYTVHGVTQESDTTDQLNNNSGNEEG